MGFEQGCYGNDRVGTPHMDRLAEQGMRFASAFTPTAICSPSRSAWFTGMYPHTNGQMGFYPQNQLHPWVTTMPAVLGAAEYRCGLIGKFHVSPEDLFPWDVEVPTGELGHGRDPEAFGRVATLFLNAVGDQPFLLSVNFSDPHRPFPKRGETKGREAEVANPHDPERVLIPPFLADDPVIREDLAAYYDAVARFDAGLGLVLKALEESGRAGDTLIMVTSDNGMAFPRAKTTLYDPGLRMPFWARWDGVIEPGTVCDEMVSFIDVLPTLCDAAGIEVPEEVQGRSFLPILRGKSQEGRDCVFGTHTNHAGERHHPSRAIRTGELKYILNLRPNAGFNNEALGSATGQAMLRLAESDAVIAERMRLFIDRPPEELYDLRSDPDEFVNVIDDPAYADALADLRARLQKWREETRDPLLQGA